MGPQTGCWPTATIQSVDWQPRQTFIKLHRSRLPSFYCPPSPPSPLRWSCCHCICLCLFNVYVRGTNIIIFILNQCEKILHHLRCICIRFRCDYLRNKDIQSTHFKSFWNWCTLVDGIKIFQILRFFVRKACDNKIRLVARKVKRLYSWSTRWFPFIPNDIWLTFNIQPLIEAERWSCQRSNLKWEIIFIAESDNIFLFDPYFLKASETHLLVMENGKKR